MAARAAEGGDAPAFRRRVPVRNAFAVYRAASGTAETIERHAFEVIEDLARLNVRYAELILIFATSVEEEYRRVIRVMEFTPADVAEFARNAFRASLLPAERVQALCAEIDTLAPEGAFA